MLMETRLLNDLKLAYGLEFQHIEAIPGGWLNRLWRAGDLLIKQYSPERFRPHQLAAIEKALQRQDAVREAGIPTPRILPCEGRLMRHLDEQNAYVVMEFSPGRNEQPETITLGQMKSLGAHCARMHQVFEELSPTGVKGYPLDTAQLLKNLHTHAIIARDSLSASDSPDCQRAVLALQPVLDDLSPTVLDGIPQGISHEDFTPDNLLFDSDGLQSIIDFDRNQYLFPWHDIGRALLSFALMNGELRRDLVSAFVEGYAAVRPFERIADALRVTWCIEAPWWIHPRSFAMQPCKASRYRDEIAWVTERWFELDNLV